MNEYPTLPEPPDDSAPLLPPRPPAPADRAQRPDHERPPHPEGTPPVVLAARGIVAYELARWPKVDAKELDLAVERLAHQGQHLGVSIEALIVELKRLVDRHAGAGRPEFESRQLREHLVSVLIEAYYRAQG